MEVPEAVSVMDSSPDEEMKTMVVRINRYIVLCVYVVVYYYSIVITYFRSNEVRSIREELIDVHYLSNFSKFCPYIAHYLS